MSEREHRGLLEKPALLVAAAAALAALCSQLATQTQARLSSQLVVQGDQLMSAAAGRLQRAAACSAEVGRPPTPADWSTCPARQSSVQDQTRPGRRWRGGRLASRVVQ